jgi:hypothetical protein
LSAFSRTVRVSLCLLTAVLLARPTPAAADVLPEDRLKAAFVYRFAQFVEWPESAVANRNAIDICVLEPNPFENLLQLLVEGEASGPRRLQVRAVSTAQAAASCHVLFLPARAGLHRETLRHVASMPVLTVSDAPRFLESGGVIQLGVAGANMRFSVNLDAARAARLRLSAQLLRLATAVRGGGQ